MKDSHLSVKKLTAAAVLMAMNIIMSISALSIPVPGGHMYLNDVIIVTAAVLLEPFYALAEGGLGAFIGDMLFYPAPMFVSLVSHGVQALVISLFVHRWMKSRPVPASVIGAALQHARLRRCEVPLPDPADPGGLDAGAAAVLEVRRGEDLSAALRPGVKGLVDWKTKVDKDWNKIPDEFGFRCEEIVRINKNTRPGAYRSRLCILIVLKGPAASQRMQPASRVTFSSPGARSRRDNPGRSSRR